MIFFEWWCGLGVVGIVGAIILDKVLLHPRLARIVALLALAVLAAIPLYIALAAAAGLEP